MVGGGNGGNWGGGAPVLVVKLVGTEEAKMDKLAVGLGRLGICKLGGVIADPEVVVVVGGEGGVSASASLA